MIKSLDEAWNFLSSLIMSNQPFREHPEIPFRRSLHMLELLGNPQNKLKIIHLAGTSGKGSTAYYISCLLESHGFKVGLHISPHLLDVRERFQINNQLIPNELFIQYLNRLKKVSDEMAKTEYGNPSYFEVLVGLSFLLFHEEKVDYAVVETGMGGWHDATNTVSRQDKLCVLTPIGLDHMNVLGKTLSQIALQKAKIIQAGNTVIAYSGPAAVRRVFEKVAQEQKAKLIYLVPGRSYRQVRLENNRVLFDFSGDVSYRNLALNTPALYQAQNAALALLALRQLATSDGFKADELKIRSAFDKPAFAGRMDMVKVGEHDVLFDGAHNPQKMKAFLSSLVNSFPKKKFHFLIAMKKGKNFQEMIKQIHPLAEDIHMTNFVMNIQDSNHLSEDPFEMAAYSGLNNPEVPVRVIPDPYEAYRAALGHLKKDEMLVVTGSLYLLSCLYSKQ